MYPPDPPSQNHVPRPPAPPAPAPDPLTHWERRVVEGAGCYISNNTPPTSFAIKTQIRIVLYMGKGFPSSTPTHRYIEPANLPTYQAGAYHTHTPPISHPTSTPARPIPESIPVTPHPHHSSNQEKSGCCNVCHFFNLKQYELIFMLASIIRPAISDNIPVCSLRDLLHQSSASIWSIYPTNLACCFFFFIIFIKKSKHNNDNSN